VPYIAPIVEGHGEVEAVPALLHRIAQGETPNITRRVNFPIRVKAGSFLNDDAYFRKQIILAAAKAAQANGFVLILLDCEDACPATRGPSILSRAQAIREDVGYLVVLAYREYESWFLAAARSLRGIRGLPEDLEPPDRIEGVRNAKDWLGKRMAIPYDPVVHQLEFSRRFDLQQARANASFNRFYDRISTTLATMP